ncbi:hypothetical protein OC845_005984 [Tilletia horrida]|nr:hypothetical protein OC845_005984 [Tilletia horrida]
MKHTKEQATQAYRAKLFLTHPDKHGESETATQAHTLMNSAYEALLKSPTGAMKLRPTSFTVGLTLHGNSAQMLRGRSPKNGSVTEGIATLHKAAAPTSATVSQVSGGTIRSETATAVRRAQ